MAGLASALLDGAHKDRVVADCVRLFEDYVAGRSGLKGIGMRYGLAIVRAKRPDIVVKSTYWLLPEFLTALDPLHARYLKTPAHERAGFKAFLVAHSREAVAAMIEVADRRVAGTPNKLVQKVYHRFRDEGLAEAAALLPGLAAIIEGHLPKATA